MRQGSKLPEETKRKISASLKGRKLSIETRMKMAAARKGHPFLGKRNYKMSDEAKNNIRKGIIEKRNTEAYIKKLSERKRGSLNPRVKLTETDVKEIRRIYATGKLSQQKIADLYGVHRSTIADIINRRTWTHIE